MLQADNSQPNPGATGQAGEWPEGQAEAWILFRPVLKVPEPLPPPAPQKARHADDPVLRRVVCDVVCDRVLPELLARFRDRPRM